MSLLAVDMKAMDLASLDGILAIMTIIYGGEVKKYFLGVVNFKERVIKESFTGEELRWIENELQVVEFNPISVANV